LADVELICTRVAIIHRGKLLRTGTIRELVSGERTEITVQGKQLLNGMLAKLKAVVPDLRQEGSDTLHLSSETQEQVTAVIDLVRGAEGNVVSVVPHKRTLEDVFVETVRKEEGV
jgi:ABC-2 type transport system ATP-binding protein